MKESLSSCGVHMHVAHTVYIHIHTYCNVMKSYFKKSTAGLSAYVIFTAKSFPSKLKNSYVLHDVHVVRADLE